MFIRRAHLPSRRPTEGMERVWGGELDLMVACLILAKKRQRVEQGTEKGKEISIPYFKVLL